MIRQEPWRDERGLTLAEVLVVIILMGLVFAIASSTWFNVVEGRRVDSATNQLAADLRLAHTRAKNQLENWQVELAADSSAYTIHGPTAAPSPRDLDDDPVGDEVVVDTTAIITFKGDGSAELPGGAPSATYTVSSADGTSSDEIEIDAALSRIEIDP